MTEEKKDNAVDLFTRKSLSKLEEEAAEEELVRKIEALKEFDTKVAMYRQAIEDNTLTGLSLVGITDDNFIQDPYVYIKDFSAFSPMAIIVEDNAEYLKSRFFMAMDGSIFLEDFDE